MKKLLSLFLASIILFPSAPLRGNDWSNAFCLTFTAIVFGYYLKAQYNSAEKTENKQNINEAIPQKKEESK